MNKFIANITIMAKTPLKVGSNGIDFLQDSPVQKDWNDLPMILGTSIAGALRAKFDKANKFFGDDQSDTKDKNLSQGSKVIISNALLCDELGKVSENLLVKKSRFQELFSSLPKRDHTAINSKGVAKEHSKFDEEIVYKGAKFKFNLELLEVDTACEDDFKYILSLLYQNSFRLGGGSTKGFGKIEVVKITYDKFDLASQKYEELENTLNANFTQIYENKNQVDENYEIYEISLTPDDFYMFGGWYDKEVDNSPVYEKVIIHKDDKSYLSSRKILIPASSVKGAISHRSTYHYNLLNDKFIGDNDIFLNVDEIFGSKKDKDKKGCKGKIIFSDIFLDDDKESKIFDHAAIDRFTGGAIDGALFQEKTISSKQELKFEILLDKNVKNKALEAFEKTLDDLCNGMLPLGGYTTKGHGMFSGKWSKK